MFILLSPFPFILATLNHYSSIKYIHSRHWGCRPPVNRAARHGVSHGAACGRTWVLQEQFLAEVDWVWRTQQSCREEATTRTGEPGVVVTSIKCYVGWRVPGVTQIHGCPLRRQSQEAVWHETKMLNLVSSSTEEMKRWHGGKWWGLRRRRWWHLGPQPAWEQPGEEHSKRKGNSWKVPETVRRPEGLAHRASFNEVSSLVKALQIKGEVWSFSTCKEKPLKGFREHLYRSLPVRSLKPRSFAKQKRLFLPLHDASDFSLHSLARAFMESRRVLDSGCHID